MEQKKKTQSFSRDMNIVDYLLMQKKKGVRYGELKRNTDPAKQDTEFLRQVEEAKARRKK